MGIQAARFIKPLPHLGHILLICRLILLRLQLAQPQKALLVVLKGFQADASWTSFACHGLSHHSLCLSSDASYDNHPTLNGIPKPPQPLLLVLCLLCAIGRMLGTLVDSYLCVLTLPVIAQAKIRSVLLSIHWTAGQWTGYRFRMPSYRYSSTGPGLDMFVFPGSELVQ